MKIKHKGLRQFAIEDSGKGIDPTMAGKLRRILSALSAATRPGEVADAAFRLHPLKGNLTGYWSIRVTRNWRVTFRFAEGEAVDVDLTDYH